MDTIAFAIFLASVGAISLTGVVMPGPVFAATVVKGVQNKHAGGWISIGHILIEVPLIVLMASGLYYIFSDYYVRAAIGVVGGALLIYMGVRMYIIRKKSEVIEQAFPMHPILAGLITTATNPYFIVWWATIGASIIIIALGFGALGVVALALVHESCDVGWYYFVGYASHSSRKLWTGRTQAFVFGTFGVILALFGIYFMMAFWITG